MGLFKKRSQSGDLVDVITLLFQNGSISEREALNIPAFSACINIISNTVASLPIVLYKEEDGKTEAVKDDVRVRLLNDDTGNLMDGVQFKRALVRDYFLHGAGYAYVNKTRNVCKSLHYIDRRDISINVGVDPIFRTADITIHGKPYRDFDFIKIVRNSKDGVRGQSVVSENTEVLSATYNLIKLERVLAKTGGSKRGFLQSVKKLDEQSISKLKEAWSRMYSDASENMVILNDGITFKDANATSVEMQLVQLIKVNSDEICKLFGVPTSFMTGNLGDDAWQLLFKTAINHVLVEFEAACNKDLLLSSEQGNHYFAFDTKELTKGDMLKRFQAYEIASRNGFMQDDEIRYMENLEPLNLGFIKLGLQNVLYYPETGEIYIPNMDKSSNKGAGTSKNGFEPPNDN